MPHCCVVRNTYGPVSTMLPRNTLKRIVRFTVVGPYTTTKGARVALKQAVQFLKAFNSEYKHVTMFEPMPSKEEYLRARTFEGLRNDIQRV